MTVSLSMRYPAAYAWAFEGDRPACLFLRTTSLQRALRDRTGHTWPTSMIKVFRHRHGHIGPLVDDAVFAARLREADGPADDFGEEAARLAEQKADRPGLHVKENGERVLVGEVVRDHAKLTPVQMIRDWGMDPDEWLVLDTKINQWDVSAKYGGGFVKATNYQTSLRLKPVYDIIVPARVEGPLYHPHAPTPSQASAETLVVLPDQQVVGPSLGYDPKLHELVCAFLETNKPHRLALTGDVPDFRSLSKFDSPQLFVDEVNVCLKATYHVMRDYVSAAGPSCWWRQYIPGNHERNLPRYILQRAPQLVQLRRADSDQDLHAIDYLLRLDELGFTYNGATNIDMELATYDWPHATVQVTDDLALRHGWLAGKGSGNTAHATLARLTHSVVVGHTHRQAIIYLTTTDIRGEPVVRYAVEAGTLAQARGGLGYDPAPDWQPGFAVIHIHPDGTTTPSLASYRNGVLTWQHQRYAHNARGGLDIAA